MLSSFPRNGTPKRGPQDEHVILSGHLTARPSGVALPLTRPPPASPRHPAALLPNTPGMLAAAAASLRAGIRYVRDLLLVTLRPRLRTARRRTGNNLLDH
ncbi:hypothetical protein BaRGS_00002042 [Batillaria attramentaria]|uniref:Uncharacterized protein n=1 Tax=Batillaria attramentaria TaxID=370345 RepID=A0ABD0M4N7_9CAEN